MVSFVSLIKFWMLYYLLKKLQKKGKITYNIKFFKKISSSLKVFKKLLEKEFLKEKIAWHVFCKKIVEFY